MFPSHQLAKALPLNTIIQQSTVHLKIELTTFLTLKD